MKKIILLGALVLAVAAVVYAANFYNTSQTVTGIAVNQDKDTLIGTQIQLQNSANPDLTPFYRGFASYTVVNMADTYSVAPGNYGVYDSAAVTVYGWWDGVKYPVYAFSQKGTLPDTFSIAIADTGAMQPLFYYDALSIDVVVTDSSGSGANDSLLWTAVHKVKLIER